MLILDFIQWWWYFNCLQMYSENFFNSYFYELKIFYTSLCQRYTGQFFGKMMAYLGVSINSFSGGCNPLNWLSQTRRNLTIGFMDFNFASRRKLCKNSVFYGNRNIAAFILFGKVFIFSRFCSFPFRKCVPLPSPSDIDILQDSVPDQ